jgi:hypothetical protein
VEIDVFDAVEEAWGVIIVSRQMSLVEGLLLDVPIILENLTIAQLVHVSLKPRTCLKFEISPYKMGTVHYLIGMD